MGWKVIINPENGKQTKVIEFICLNNSKNLTHVVPFLNMCNGQQQVLTAVLIMCGGALENGFLPFQFLRYWLVVGAVLGQDLENAIMQSRVADDVEVLFTDDLSKAGMVERLATAELVFVARKGNHWRFVTDGSDLFQVLLRPVGLSTDGKQLTAAGAGLYVERLEWGRYLDMVHTIEP